MRPQALVLLDWMPAQLRSAAQRLLALELCPGAAVHPSACPAASVLAVWREAEGRRAASSQPHGLRCAASAPLAEGPVPVQAPAASLLQLMPSWTS